MKKLLLNLLLAVIALVGIMTCWQGMNELYKFDKCDYTKALTSFFITLDLFFIVFHFLLSSSGGVGPGREMAEVSYEIIVLNSKEELLACEKYFNQIGYKTCAGHSRAGKYFTLYHGIKEYQNLHGNCGYPIATLGKFGITVESESNLI